MINEIRAFLHYTERDYPLYFWRNSNGVEVDIILETSNGFVAIEFKYGNRWEKRFNRGMHKLSAALGKGKVSCCGVFMGDRTLLLDDIVVHPALDFLKRLWAEEIIS